MTQYFLSINRGQLEGQTGNVLVATSAPTADFYLQIDATTHSPTRKDTLFALEAIKNYILSDGVSGGQRGTDLPIL
jgi:hypothetical protein